MYSNSENEEKPVIATGDKWAAAWLLSQGVRLVGTDARRSWVRFLFDNTDGQAAQLHEQWRAGYACIADVRAVQAYFYRCGDLLNTVKAA